MPCCNKPKHECRCKCPEKKCRPRPHCECKVPCNCKEYTLAVLDTPPVDLANGTATIQLKKNGYPLSNTKVGISFVICPGGPTTTVLLKKHCHADCTDEDGIIDLNFKKGAQNQVRIIVNIFVNGCEDEKCCIRLTACIAPPDLMGVTPLNYLSLDDNWTDLKLYLSIQRNNELLIQASITDVSFPGTQQGGPTRGSRALAISQIAMADAFNSIEQKFAIYTPGMPLFPGGDPHAAIAQANHDALVALYSNQTTTFDAALASFLSEVPDGTAKTIGIAAGKKAAELILALRTNDGSQVADGTAQPYLSTPAGIWSEAPPEVNAGGNLALGSHWGAVTPFALASSNQFRCPPPPPLTSKEYAAAFNEVKSTGAVGDATSPTTRSQDQTDLALYWSLDGSRFVGLPLVIFAHITTHLLTQYEANPVDLLRILTLVHTGMADAGISCWEAKYTYNHWRPITAVRFTPAVNPDAVPQTNWVCLGAPASNQSNGGKNFVPAFPGHCSGHSTFGSAVFQILRRYFGTDDIPFQFCSPELNGVTTDNLGNVRPFRPRSFMRLSQAEQENARSRIYLGVHFCYEAEGGQFSGRKVGDWVYDHKFRA